MHKIILLGGAAALVLGAGSAYAMGAGGGGDLSPEQSPYAILAPQTLQQQPMSEGRAAYTGGDRNDWRRDGARAPGGSPYDRDSNSPNR